MGGTCDFFNDGFFCVKNMQFHLKNTNYRLERSNLMDPKRLHSRLMRFALVSALFTNYKWDYKQQGFSFSAIESLNSESDPNGAGNLEKIHSNRQSDRTEDANNLINGVAVFSYHTYFTEKLRYLIESLANTYSIDGNNLLDNTIALQVRDMAARTCPTCWLAVCLPLADP